MKPGQQTIKDGPLPDPFKPRTVMLTVNAVADGWERFVAKHGITTRRSSRNRKVTR